MDFYFKPQKVMKISFWYRIFNEFRDIPVTYL